MHAALRQQAVILKHETDFLVAERREVPGRQAEGFVPPSVTVPVVGGSSAPRMYSSVLLPLPDGPMIAAASPGANVSETSDSTDTSPCGDGYDLPTPLDRQACDLS